MERHDFVLACMSPAENEIFRPVQVQKLFFLIDRNLHEILGGQYFNFEPYNYGPFDKTVYEALEALAAEEMIEIVQDHTWKSYKLTNAGLERGRVVFEELPEKAKAYITQISNFVLSLSFTQLVRAIYNAYPEMRANSVFQE